MQMHLSGNRHNLSLPPFQARNARPGHIERKDVKPTDRKRSRMLRNTANDEQLDGTQRVNALADWMTIAAECSE
eukprot:4338971-Amphidinium_carterae.1